MSFPPHGPPPPPYYGPPGWAPPNPNQQKPNHPYPYPGQPDYGQLSGNGPQMPYPYYVPGAVMLPYPMPVPPPDQPTYITNIIYQGENSNQQQPSEVQISESDGDYSWVPSTATTASSLSGKAVIGGHEGWDGSPLWVIRSWHHGDLIPGKLSVRHNSASVMYNGKEIPVQNIEVLCAKPENLRWVPSSNGNLPPGSISGGKTANGEKLYVGRARHQLSITPGKIHPSHKMCYIGFGGAEVALSSYDVLCRIS